MANPIFSEIEIADTESLLRAIQKASDCFPGIIWWRGCAQFDWKLVPSIFRAGYVAGREANLAIRFRLKAPARYRACPPAYELMQWLSLMQHYRLPTRILDWTESPLVGLFFAIREQPEVDGALWSLGPFKLSEVQTGRRGVFLPDSKEAQNLVADAFRLDAELSDSVLPVSPAEVDLRMLLQQAGATVHGSDGPLEERSWASQCLLKYRVKAASKNKIRNELEYLGVRESALFPDLEYVAQDLARIKFVE